MPVPMLDHRAVLRQERQATLAAMATAPTKEFTRQKLKALFDARLSRHDKEHREHEAALKKMFDKHAKARNEMHARHQKARAAMHSDHLKGMDKKPNPLHDNPRSKP